MNDQSPPSQVDIWDKVDIPPKNMPVHQIGQHIGQPELPARQAFDEWNLYMQFVLVHEMLPTQAGLTYEQALEYEAKEYRKVRDSEFMKDYESTIETMEGHARALARAFAAVSKLYGETP